MSEFENKIELSDNNSAPTTEESEYVPGSFEGPEKTMEVVFHPKYGPSEGLRLLTREQVDLICLRAKCSILTKCSTKYLDAYVLSESSLFMYSHRLIMKTCGTTTLLKCLKTVISFADELGLQLSWFGYSRKNLRLPLAQHFPHCNFTDELNYIDSEESGVRGRINGSGHILGPITGDHWFVYAGSSSNLTTLSSAASLSSLATPSSPSSNPSVLPILNSPTIAKTVTLMMFDIHRDCASKFFRADNGLTAKQMTTLSAIHELVPGATIDENAFEPCGYSMNACLHDAYSTIHITPEEEGSYASFETNTCIPTYHALIKNVLNVFKPKRFMMTMFGVDDVMESMMEIPTEPAQIIAPSHGVYIRTVKAHSKVCDLNFHMATYNLHENLTPGTLSGDGAVVGMGLMSLGLSLPRSLSSHKSLSEWSEGSVGSGSTLSPSSSYSSLLPLTPTSSASTKLKAFSLSPFL